MFPLRCWILLGLLLAAPLAILAAGRGVIEVQVVDSKTSQPLAARMHLRDQKGKVIKVPGTVHHADHFSFASPLKLELPKGNYYFELEGGPEYKTLTGNFYLDEDTVDQKEHRLERFIDLAAEGWYAGDCDVRRPAEHLELLMRADDLHFIPATTWGTPLPKQLPGTSEFAAEPKSFAPASAYELSAGCDQRAGGGLCFFGLPEPLQFAALSAEHPSSAAVLERARSAGSQVQIARAATAWDLPLWLSTGQLSAVNILHGELLRDGAKVPETGKPRDRVLYGNASGVGRWSQDIYYHLLNAGLRVPPSAGSGSAPALGSGAGANPVGYNRVYVHCSQGFSPAAWWEGLRTGKVMVTNGPLMTPRFNDQPPGHVFTADKGGTVEISIALNLATKEKIAYLEIIHNGQSVQEVRLDEWARNQGVLPPVVCRESGWLLVRAVTDNATTYRYAMSGPVYVEIDYQQRISKRSAQFFLDWVVERAKRIQLDDAAQRAEVIAYHRQARDFWQALVAKANAE